MRFTARKKPEPSPKELTTVQDHKAGYVKGPVLNDSGKAVRYGNGGRRIELGDILQSVPPTLRKELEQKQRDTPGTVIGETYQVFPPGSGITLTTRGPVFDNGPVTQLFLIKQKGKNEFMGKQL
jgi:hypothetical protein